MHSFIHQSKFKTRRNLLINLASEVPPVVDNFGLILVIFLIIFFAIKIVFPGFVKKASPLDIKLILKLHLFFYSFFLQLSLFFLFKETEVCKLLYLILNCALALAGITLWALLSTFIDVNSKLEG